MPAIPGFIAVGKTEFLMILIGFTLLGVVLGVLGMVIRNIIKAQPPGRHRAENRCPRPHLDSREELGQWLRANDYALMPNELATTFPWPRTEQP